jgi:hypothetical protein
MGSAAQEAPASSATGESMIETRAGRAESVTLL